MWKKEITRKEIGGNWIFPLIVMIVITSPLWAMGIAYAVGSICITSDIAIEETWGIDVPSDFREVYHESEDNFHGRVPLYGLSGRGNAPNVIEGFRST